MRSLRSIDCAWDVEEVLLALIIFNDPVYCANMCAWNVASNTNNIQRDGIWWRCEVFNAIGDALGCTVINFDLKAVRIKRV
jgi:hypothetical protein